MYGCPGCGAELKYDIKTGKLRCSRCGNKYDVQAIKKDKDAESSLYEIAIVVHLQFYSRERKQ